MAEKNNSLFDVTMESFDGAEICEIVGLYLLDKLSNLSGKENVGLYRDDSLAAINSCSGLVLDRTRKKNHHFIQEGRIKYHHKNESCRDQLS